MEKGNGNTVLLTIIGISTLLVALVGATFAYFTATVSNDNAQSISVTTATPVGLEYLGSKLELLNAIPGQSAGTDSENPVTFTVTNPADSTTAQKYDLDLIIDANGFTYTTTDAAVSAGKSTAPQLVITITSSTNMTNVPKFNDADSTGTVVTLSNTENNTDNVITIDATDSTNELTKNEAVIDIVNGQLIDREETQTYAITLEFKELDIAQDNNQGQDFGAHIEVNNPVSVNS